MMPYGNIVQYLVIITEFINNNFKNQNQIITKSIKQPCMDNYKSFVILLACEVKQVLVVVVFCKYLDPSANTDMTRAQPLTL